MARDVNRKTKILIVGESPVAPTGMAEVIRLIFGTLLDRFAGRYELHQVALFHSHSVTAPRWPVYSTKGATIKDGIPLFQINDAYGEITFREVVSKLQPDIVFAHNDPQRVLHLCSNAAERAYKLVLYVNFDGFPYAANHGPILNQAEAVITMSEFSSRVALACLPDIDPIKVSQMYSPADTERFRPLPEFEKRALRARLFPKWLPTDAFVLGWVGRNQWRKQVWLNYEIIHHLRTGDYFACRSCGRVTLLATAQAESRIIPAGLETEIQTASQMNRCTFCGEPTLEMARPMSDVFLWLHMPDERTRQDWPRSCLEEQFGVSPGTDIHYTDEGRELPFRNPSEMAALYQMWDCLLYLSGGEGFGLPAWEAMCCALPVVYTNYSSHAEFLSISRAGLPVGGTLQPEPNTCIMRLIADVPGAIEALRKMYFDRNAGRVMGLNGRSFCERFSLIPQAERWHQLFQGMLSSD